VVVVLVVQRFTVEAAPHAATCGKSVLGAALAVTARLLKNLGTIRRFSPGHQFGSDVVAIGEFGVASDLVQSVRMKGYGPGGIPHHFSPVGEVWTHSC
jgi:hypothetical protein